MPDTSSSSLPSAAEPGQNHTPPPAPRQVGRWGPGVAENAGREGIRGAIAGAAKWGLATAALGAVGWRFSPLYRSFTLQFKVYVLTLHKKRAVLAPLVLMLTCWHASFIHMAGMILGATVESDRRIREVEYRIRVQRRMERQAAHRRQLYGDDYD